jgi:hypothetical protein
MKFPNIWKDWKLVALALAVSLAILYLLVPAQAHLTKKINSDIAKVNSRFTPTESVDVAMAMKMMLHDPPSMLNPPEAPPPLLLYPPSKEDLARLSGE